jgi:hypothetical protein
MGRKARAKRVRRASGPALDVYRSVDQVDELERSIERAIAAAHADGRAAAGPVPVMMLWGVSDDGSSTPASEVWSDGEIRPISSPARVN